MKYLFRVIGLGLLLWGCAGKNPEAERARDAIILLCRSQEAFYVEQGRFTDRLDELKIDWLNLKETTPNYRYQLYLLNSQNTIGIVTIGTNSKADNLVGIVTKLPNNEINTILCGGRTAPPEVVSSANCPPGFTLISVTN